MFTRTRIAPLVAEFIGTSLWVMVALIMSETTAVAYFIATSVALALAVSYALFYGISGAHFNPAITFGVWTARRIGTIRGIAYIVVQLLAGLASWQLYQYFVNRHLPAKSVHFSAAMWLAEVVGTAILAMGFVAAMAKVRDTLQSALVVAAALFVGVLIAATASAGYLNPAVALGLRSFNAVYILGPLVGGLIGVNLYGWLFMESAAPRAHVVKRTKV